MMHWLLIFMIILIGVPCLSILIIPVGCAIGIMLIICQIQYENFRDYYRAKKESDRYTQKSSDTELGESIKA